MSLIFTIEIIIGKVVVYIEKYIYILELSWLENTANSYMRHMEHWTAVLTLLGLISSTHCDLHHHSMQKPKFYH